MFKNNESKILFLLLIIGFILRYFSTNCYDWDEYVNLQQAEIFFGKINNYEEFLFRPQLLSFMISVMYHIRHDPIVANLLLTVMSTLSILLIYLCAKEMFNDNVAILSAILLTFSPLHVYYSHYLLTNNPGLFFGLLSLYFLKKGETDQKPVYFSLAGIFLSCAITTRFDFLIFVPIYLLNYIFFYKIYKTKYILALLSGFILTTLPYLAWSSKHFGNPFIPFIEARVVVDIVLIVNQDPFLYLKNIHTLAGVFGIIGFFYWLISTLKNRTISKNEIILITLTIVTFIYLNNMKLKEDRYLIAIIPGFIILSAIGLDRILSLMNKRYIYIYLFLIILGCILFPISKDQFRLSKDYCMEKEMSLSIWINNNLNKNYPIYMLQPLYPAIGYYTQNKLITVPANKDIFLNHFQFKGNSYFIIFEEQMQGNESLKLEDLEQMPGFKLIKTMYLYQNVYIFSITR